MNWLKDIIIILNYLVRFTLIYDTIICMGISIEYTYMARLISITHRKIEITRGFDRLNLNFCSFYIFLYSLHISQSSSNYK